MKKSLIALALAGAFSGAAFAQSNVTLYGILDVNLQNNNPNGTQSSTTGVNGGHQSGNRWGVRGTEALGGGWSAIFTLESGFSIDTGESARPVPALSTQLCQGPTGLVAGSTPTQYQASTCPTGTTSAGSLVTTQQSTRLFDRQAWAGLSSERFGSLVAGRIATFSSGTGSFDMFGAVDPFATGFGDSSLGSTFSSANALRLDNTVAYVSPKFAGLQLGAAYSFNAIGAEVAGSSNNARVMGLGANWGTGPFYVVVTYDTIELPNAVTNDTQKHLQIGGTWDFKIAKLHAAYAKEDDVRLAGTGNSSGGVDADAWMVGVTVPLFGGSLLGSYQDRNADGLPGSTGAAADGPDVTVWAIGYTYPLSRRTNLYLNWSNRDGGGTNAGNATWDRKQSTIGVRHLF